MSFEHLPKPFMPGAVVPSSRSPGEWHYSFRCAEGHLYYVQTVDYGLASDAKLAMRQHCARSGNRALAKYLDASQYPGSGRGLFSPRLR